MFYYCAIAEAKARIESPRNKEVHVRRRSRVRLTCVVDLGGQGQGQGRGRGPEVNAAAVFWYLDGRALDWVGQTGPGRGVQVCTQVFCALTPVLQKKKVMTS